MFTRKEVLDCVPETLDTDAKLMQCHLRTATHGALVQIVGSGPFVECEMSEDDTAGSNAGGAARKTSAPLPPLLSIKLLQILESFLFALRLAVVHVIKQFDRHRIIGPCQLFNPFLHYVHVAQLAECLENFLPRLLHVFPAAVGIHGHQAIGERTATAN